MIYITQRKSKLLFPYFFGISDSLAIITEKKHLAYLQESNENTQKYH